MYSNNWNENIMIDQIVRNINLWAWVSILKRTNQKWDVKKTPTSKTQQWYNMLFFIVNSKGKKLPFFFSQLFGILLMILVMALNHWNNEIMTDKIEWGGT